jgi:DNA-binding SARP family transcriptional activator/tetratricopeptide (TPR) repeat protein
MRAANRCNLDKGVLAREWGAVVGRSRERKIDGAGQLRVGVLGPVTASHDGQDLRVGQPRQQAVLGILAMGANRVISRGELIDGVWGQDPPPSAEGGIYTYVAGLRRVIEPGRSVRGPGQVLVSSGGGYVLHLMPGQPDAVALEQYVARARQLRQGGDLTDSLAALDAGLGLWRGTAFAGVPGPFAETERTRLAELRVATDEERADVLLALGRHEEIVPDLTALVAAHPLRERMRGQLMIALYRVGRQAEALGVFGEGRRLLAEELGIDPGTELSRIHRQVLSMDAALDSGRGESPAPGPRAERAQHRPGGHQTGIPVPAQLPLDSHGFSGRREELRVLHEVLPPPGPVAAATAPSVGIAVISGTAGVGKTALAIRFGRAVAGSFRGGQLFVNLRGLDPAMPPMESGEALRFFLDSFGVPPYRIPENTLARAALYRSLVDGRKMLIVLDNASSEAQVRPLLPGSPGCLVLVTSRSQMTGLVAAEGAVPISLDVLDRDEASEMLARRLGRARTAAEPRAVGEIIDSCARLPLALSIAAGLAVGPPRRRLDELAAELRDATSRLDALAAADAVTDARTVLSWSYNQLSVPSARMFRQLGLHPGPDISLPAATSLAGTPRPAAAAALRELASTHMVAERMPARFTFHDLLRAYAVEQAERYDSAQQRREALHRVLDHYLRAAMAASMRFSPHRVPLRLGEPQPGVQPAEFSAKDQAIAWFDAEAAVLFTLVGHAYAHGFDAHAWQISWAVAAFCARRGRLQESVASQRTALAAAERLGDRLGQAHARYELAHAQWLLEDYDAAEQNVRKALEEFRALGDRAGEAEALNGLSMTLEKRGRPAEALALALDGLRVLRAAGHRWAQGTLENTAGWMFAHLGQYAEALTHCRRALALHRESGNRGGAADALRGLGFVHRHLGHYLVSAEHYQQAAAVYREIGDALGEGQAMAGLGDMHADEGNLTAARAALFSAAAILDTVPHRLAEEVRARLHDLERGTLTQVATIAR